MVQGSADLKGRTIALTRPSGQAEEAGKLIEQRGGVPYYIPAIEIKGLSEFSAVKKFITEMQKQKVDFVIFMSTNGVKYLFSAAESLKQTGELQQGLAKTFVIAIGPRTAQELEAYCVTVSLVPEKYSSEGLIESLQGKDLGGKTVRIPRTTNATPLLTDKLREMSVDVEEVYVYESGLPVDEGLKQRFFEDLVGGRIDAIVFGSGLSAKNIFKMLTEKASMDELCRVIRDKVTTVAIGPTTAQALQELGVRVDVVPEDYLFESALEALARHWRSS